MQRTGFTRPSCSLHSGVLKHGDAVVVEAEPKFYGYMAQAILSATLRPLSDLEARLFAASRTCFEALMTELRPGRSYKDLISSGGCSPNGKVSSPGGPWGMVSA